ncbi:MAG TPA: hypothetical protein VJ962_12675 [Clostridia bacterium]|nr:hypothetical protein [Clostridia bacterium]
MKNKFKKLDEMLLSAEIQAPDFIGDQIGTARHLLNEIKEEVNKKNKPFKEKILKALKINAILSYFHDPAFWDDNQNNRFVGFIAGFILGIVISYIIFTP